MTSDNKIPMCSESDLFEIADRFHSLFLAHRERLIQLIVKWWDEHRGSTWPTPPPRLFPLPQRDLSLPEKAVCLAAIHDKVWKGDLINPFPADEFTSQLDRLRKTEEARDFRQLTKHVLDIPTSDLRHLNRHLDFIDDWLEHPERDNRASHNKTTSPVAPSIDSAGRDTGGIQNGEGSEPVASGQPAHKYTRVTKKALCLVLKISKNTLRKRINDGEIPVHPDDLLDDKKTAKNIRIESTWYKTQQSTTQ
ncbi:MAG: hypothetical protein O2945_08895 [Planctomycetota bacterium]|nr:hypothetical protein [Planctomycetota bacterium]